VCISTNKGLLQTSYVISCLCLSQRRGFKSTPHVLIFGRDCGTRSCSTWDHVTVGVAVRVPRWNIQSFNACEHCTEDHGGQGWTCDCGAGHMRHCLTGGRAKGFYREIFKVSQLASSVQKGRGGQCHCQAIAREEGGLRGSFWKLTVSLHVRQLSLLLRMT
jgi:hypothetical protein